MMTLPFSSRSVMRGFRSLPRGCCFQSMTTRLEMPVVSSITSRIDTPSTRSM
jgi:hypothetical protein